MPAYWILPNRDQKDELCGSDGEKVLPLRQVLDPALLPPGFSNGVPTELLEKCGPRAFGDILFAQRFPDWDGGKQLFSVSATAGLDATGRVVHLGLLFILAPHERPRFELSYGGLSEEDKTYARALLHRMRMLAPGDHWARSVRELGERSLGNKPAINVTLDRSTVRFYSLYTAGPGGLSTKLARWRPSGAMAIFLLFIFAMIGVWLFAQAKHHHLAPQHSEQSLQPAGQMGVA
jgi:hypothetical protein